MKSNLVGDREWAMPADSSKNWSPIIRTSVNVALRSIYRAQDTKPVVGKLLRLHTDGSAVLSDLLGMSVLVKSFQLYL